MCGLYDFNEVPIHFFKSIITTDEYGDHLFPNWFVPILEKSPMLQKEFIELANNIFSKSVLKRKKVYAVFLNNNRISRLCENKIFALKSLEVDLNDVEMSAKKVFFRLYDSTLQGGLVKNELGESIHDHYRKFREANISQACPFCGLENYPDRIKNSRSEYDHYLYKANYYFSSVNFMNLVPMCSICNKAPNKHMQDIIFDNHNLRRLAFYPYSNSSGALVTLNNVVPSKVGDGGQWNVSVLPVAADESEKVETWKNVFNIESRYAARIKEEAESWIEEFIIQADLPSQDEDIEAWRDAFRVWSIGLSNINEIKVVRNGILKQPYFEYLYRDASDPEISGIKQMAQSDLFTVRQLAVGQ